jgi:hypothetical protein
MRLHNIYLSIFIFFEAATLVAATKPINYDDAALTQFWKIADQLHKGKSPAPRDWDSMLDATGYQTLITATGKSRDEIRDALENAYLPQKASYRKDILNGSDLSRKIELQHLINAWNKRGLIRSLTAKLRKENIYHRSLNLSRTLLSQESSDIQPPKISLAIFGLNAHANDLGVVADAWFLQQIIREQRILRLIAHEMHHYFLDKLRIVTKSKVDRNRPFASLAYNIHKEGIADLIDKPDYLENGSFGVPEALLREHRLQFGSANKVIQAINREYQRMVKTGKENFKMNWQVVRPIGGHASGFYMAQKIKQAGLLPKLIGKITDPFEIFFLYNMAVSPKDRIASRFSPALLDHLKSLQAIK